MNWWKRNMADEYDRLNTTRVGQLIAMWLFFTFAIFATVCFVIWTIKFIGSGGESLPSIEFMTKMSKISLVFCGPGGALSLLYQVKNFSKRGNGNGKSKPIVPKDSKPITLQDSSKHPDCEQ